MVGNTPATNGPRIVLLGMTGAGKSSLLGALAQAALTQPKDLGGELTDITGGLAELQKGIYDNKQSDTLEEIASYPVTLHAEAMVPATLIDCDGRLAQEYLEGKRSLDERALLSEAIGEADALVLAVAPAEQGQLQRSIDQFSQFLKRFEQRRGRRGDIAGLPVYLVLTKCDLLARKDDTARAWVGRIEEAKRKIANEFRDFTLGAKVVPFGKIALRLAATSVKQPALLDRPACPREPFGVAELFRQVVGSALAFHVSRSRAQRRLHLAIAGLLGLIAIMALVVTGFYFIRPSPEVAALENSIRAALPSTSAAQRLREPLDQRYHELAKIQDNSGFAGLPSLLQEEVRDAIQEVNVYQALGKKFYGLKLVRFFKKEDEIQTNSQALDNIILPQAWEETQLARRMRQYKSELSALAKDLAAEREWLKKQIEEGDRLRRMAIPGEDSPARQEWINKADAFLKRKDLTKDVPHVSNMKLRELYEFPSVNSLRKDYDTIRLRVEQIRGGLANS
jgi:GTPase SAR1 family protein